MIHYATSIETPVGPITITTNPEGALRGIVFDTENRPPAVTGSVIWDEERCRLPAVQLAEYFSKHRQTFDLELDLVGTEFQRRV